MNQRRRTWWLAAGAAVTLLAATGCGNGGDQGSTSPSQPPSSGGASPAKLEAFYNQKVAWEKCAGMGDDEKTVCAWVEVPLDYNAPEGEKLKLRMLKVPAKGASGDKAPKGAMLVNPGGPGGSAVDYARAADFVVSGQVRKNFDIVGFDPRGVGQSNPLTCVDDAGVDKIIGSDPTPDSEADFEALKKVSREFGDACKKKYPSVLEHVSTVDAAKDMDIVRGVLGQPKLDYLGKSYGTFLGATYAGLFPDKVGHLVLDGAMAPDLTDKEMNLGQAIGFETATRAYVEFCIKDGDCPLGGDVEGGLKKMQSLLKQLDAKPLKVTGDPRVTELTEGWASTGFARAMYDQTMWRGLTDAIRGAMGGDGNGLFGLAREYADRGENGKYAGNIMQVLPAVNCLDRPAEPQTFAQMQERSKEFAQKAPTWGPFMVWGSTTCETWPVRSGGKPEKIAAKGSAPIVVVGTTRDPATPYQWAERLADQLENGHLVTFDGDGHTAYMRSNRCVDGAVDAYFMEGTVPKKGLKC